MMLNLPRRLEDDIKSFCELNEIKDINEFLVSCLSKGYSIIKYGETPKDNFNKENKPLEFEKYEKAESNAQGMEGDKKGRNNKNANQQKEKSESVKEEEPIKTKKKIRILKD